MFDTEIAIKGLFLGLAGGLVLTLAYWLYVGLLAWRSLRKSPAFEGVRFWAWNLRALVSDTSYLWVFARCWAFCNFVLAAIFAARQI